MLLGLLCCLPAVLAAAAEATPDTMPPPPPAAVGEANDHAAASCPATAGDASRTAALYDIGDGVAQDFAVAAACYRVAAKAGDRAAQFNLGAMYDNGRGTARDETAAVAWYEKAAAQGDGRAAYALGLIAEQKPDAAAARKWFRLAATDGIAAARGKIAALAPPPEQSRHKPEQGRKLAATARPVQSGSSRPPAPEPAAPAVPVAKPASAGRTAERGVDEYLRGMALLTSGGEPQDRTAAAVWFTRGANLGSDLAAYALASLYEKGDGVAPNPVLAAAWYRVAAGAFAPGTKEHAAADAGVARVEPTLSPQQRSDAAAQARSLTAGIAAAR